MEGDFFHKSSFNFDPLPDPQQKINGYNIFGVSVGFGPANDKWLLSIFAKNLFDKRIPSYILADPLSSAEGDTPKGDYVQQFDKSSFRSVGASLDFKF